MAKLYFYYSAMNAGKTTTLLQAAYNYRERGMDVLLFVATIDNRYEKDKITSRIGLKADAIMFDEDFNFFDYIKAAIADNPNIKCIFVDEAHFMQAKHVDQLAKVTVFLNKPVITYGLRSDFRAKLFPATERLLALAEELVEIKTMCHCGRKATMNMRINEKGQAVREGPQIEVGGNDRYISVCREHFMLGDAGDGFQEVDDKE